MDNLFESLPDTVREGIRELGWAQPMPVQAQVLPMMREGHDLIVQAQTGSGKTGAFGIPIVSKLEAEKKGCQALVMCPTRELAGQVAGEIEAIGRPKGIHCLPIYGGVGYQEQIDGIEAGHHVIVGTPGRILDHLGSGRLSFAGVETLILDEADEMLSLGFWPDMREINKYLPKQRQSCLFSATIPEKVLSLSRFFLDDPKRISLSEDQMAPQEIEHYFVVVSAHEKQSALLRIIEDEEPESAIVFCNTKDDVRQVTNFLQRNGLDADQISGDLNQSARERAMTRIKQGELRFLVATDVAARGIDISDLSHVISFAAPASPDVYVHRTGRTGRAGKAGTAVSLVSGLDIGNFQFLQHANKIRIEERKLPSPAQTAEKLGERLHARIGDDLAQLRKPEFRDKLERFLPLVEKFAADPEGRLDLAALCAAFLEAPARPRAAQGTGAETPVARAADDAPSRSEKPGNRKRTGRRRRPRGKAN